MYTFNFVFIVLSLSIQGQGLAYFKPFKSEQDAFYSSICWEITISPVHCFV